MKPESKAMKIGLMFFSALRSRLKTPPIGIDVLFCASSHPKLFPT